MEYRKTITLKDGRKCILRNGTEKDGKAVLDNFILTHEQTDNLLSYVTNSDSGQGLICCGGSIIPFRDKFPKNKLYDLMTTRLEELS